MSIKQINKVFDDITLKGNEKLLMLALADNCNDSGVCFPSWNSLITKTSMSKGSVSKWLKLLEDKKLVFRVSRNRQNGSRTSNKYLIYPIDNKSNLDEEDYLIFEDLYIQSSEVELPTKVQKLNYPSSEVELPNGGQSSEVEHLEPSLSFNHYSKPSLKQKKENLFSQLIKQYEHYDIYENIALDFIAYRKLIKKPLKTILPIKQFIDSLIELSKLGYSFDYCIEQMKSNEWQTVKKDYIHKPSKPQQKSRAESNREFIEKHYGINEDNIIDTEIM